MNKYYIAQCQTTDDLLHQGLYFEPKEKLGTAILYVHGLSSVFHGHMGTCDAFAEIGEQTGIGFASFNNRGFNLISGIQKKDPTALTGINHVPGGAGQEVFEECVLDIDAGITFLGNFGYKNVVLVGRSTGANKVCFYAGTVDDPRVLGVVLNSSTSDRLTKPKEQVERELVFMKKMITEGKENELFTGYSFFPMTPKRYISLFEKGSKEDVFDYGDEKPEMKIFSQIKKPLFVILGEKDEHVDRSVADVIKVFDGKTNSSKYKSLIMSGALHGFEGYEQDLAVTICSWIKTL
ncbi:MAG: DUF1749 domain-containing protein [Microgenomates group bacterium]